MKTTTYYNKVKRIVMLTLGGVMTATTLQAQEALHLFYKNGTQEKIAITEDTHVEFVKQPHLKLDYYGMQEGTLHISANAGRTDNYGFVTTNVPWTVSTDAEWLKVRHDKMEKYKYAMGDGMKQTNCLIFAEANKTGQERTATVTFSTKNGEESTTLIVVQHPYKLSLDPMRQENGFEAVITREESIAWDATEYYAYAYPNFDVNVLSYPNWMSLDTIAYGADGYAPEKVDQVPDSIPVTWENLGFNHTIARFKFDPNRSANMRSGNIIFEANGETAILTVKQEGLTDATMLAALEAIQLGMMEMGSNHDQFGHMSTLHATDMMTEDMTMFGNSWFAYDYEHSYNAPIYRRNSDLWYTYYNIITRANTTIDLVEDTKEQVSNENFVLGNAYAYRAMAYLYLIQLFQDPTTKDGINTSLPGVPMLYAEIEKAAMGTEQIEYFKGRNTVGEVFAQIEVDITRAIELLQGEVRPSKNYIDITVAQGIAARYYLLAQDWAKAATMANAASYNYHLMDGDTETNGIRDGFMDITNEEWMWGFDHTPETQTTYASFFSHISNLTSGYSGIGYTGRGVDARLFEQMSATDYRRAYWYRDAEGNTQSTAAASPDAYMWQKPYAFLKFGWKEDWTQDYIYMRAAEMTLIEAEAQARMGNQARAAETLSMLMRKRDPSWNMSSVSVDDIHLQRRLELIGEGHAYFDLKRLNKGIERNYEGNNHLEGYQLNKAENDSTWVYQIPLSAIDDDYTYNLTEEDNQ